MFNPTMDDSLPPSLIAPFDLFLEVVIQKSEALGKPHGWAQNGGKGKGKGHRPSMGSSDPKKRGVRQTTRLAHTEIQSYRNSQKT